MSISPEQAAAALESWEAYQRYLANHPPVSPGGGSISGTDGTTTVNPMTSLRLPAGTLADLGSGVGGVGLLLHLIGPLPITYQTPGIQSGTFFIPLDVGTLVIQTWGITTEEWASQENGTSGPTPADITLTSDASGSQTMSSTGDITGTSVDYASDAVAYAFANYGTAAGQTPGKAPTFLINGPNGGLYVQIGSGLTLTAGAMDIYAIVATPAA